MSIFKDDNLNITMYQGDTGTLIFTGLPKGNTYSGYFSINNDETGAILNEKQADEYNYSAGSAKVIINEDFSNALPIGEWTYSFKVCTSGGTENTVIPIIKEENGKIIKKNPPAFVVLDKRAEGV